MPLETGHILQNRYRIVALLGQGGMGAVYRSWDLRLKKPIALKEMVPQPGLDAEMLKQFRTQFEQEAVILGKLRHQHLVPVTDYFEEDGRDYLAMEFVEGENLAAKITREGPLPEPQVVAWAGQLLDALAYCHECGVVHRDIKPQNVVITPKGSAVLVDFGLVKLWDPTDPQTRTVMRGVGTPEYAPPEQWGTLGYHTDPRSDLYSLGATLYHALAGKAPLTASDRIAYPQQFRTPRELTGRVTAAVDAAITRAMALSCDDRWPSAGVMAQALGAAGPPPPPIDAAVPAAPPKTQRVSEPPLVAVAPMPTATQRASEPLAPAAVAPTPTGTQRISEPVQAAQPGPSPSTTRRWMVPLLSFAAVALLACVMGVVLLGFFPAMATSTRALLLFGIPGAASSVAYFVTGRKQWWILILGGLLIALGLAVGLDPYLSVEATSALFFLLGGLTFLLVYALTTPRRHMWWMLILAALLGAMGLLVLPGTGPHAFWALLGALVLIGGYVLLRKRRK